MTLALGYAWSNSPTNPATPANAVNNRLGNPSFSNVQSLIAPIGNLLFRRSTATSTSNFAVTDPNATGVASIHQGHSSGINLVNFTGTIHLANVTFSGHTLGQGEIYGDNINEFGLQMLANGTATNTVVAGYSGLSGFAAGASSPVSLGSIRYNVQAVPEPATMAALGLGLAAMARRRRNKK